MNSKKAKFDENDPSLQYFTNKHYEITELIPSNLLSYLYSILFADLPPDYATKDSYENI